MRTWIPIALIAGFFLAGCSLVVGKDGKPCTSDSDCGDLSCVDGVCIDETACTDECSPEGSKRCDPSGPDVQLCSRNLDTCLNWIPDPDNNCSADQHCDPGTFTCVAGCASYCTDGQRRCNQDGWTEVCIEAPQGSECWVWQTQVDCAANGQTCDQGNCVGQEGFCDDGIWNQDETDVDCGGSTCGGCQSGYDCVDDADCLSNDCTALVCVSRWTCSDQTQNQDETDVDCGGLLCPPCMNAHTCNTNADCESGNCASGVCACQDECTQSTVSCQGSNRSECNYYESCLQWNGQQDCSALNQVCVFDECMAPGDDGTASSNSPAPMFKSTKNDTDHLSDMGTGDGFINEDGIRKLVWNRCPEGMSEIGCTTGTRTHLTWQEAYDHCEALVFAGSEDWHLPDRFELQSIHRYGLGDPIDAFYFPNTAGLWYWTSSTDASDSGRAWRIQSSTGTFGTETKAGNPHGYVRCVRRTEDALALPAVRFHRTRTTEPVVLDRITDLFWQACPPDQTGADCSGQIAISQTWTQADAMSSYCAGLSWGPFTSGWRLPSTKELSSLVDDRSNPPIDQALGPLANDLNYITADTLAGGPDRPYAVDFTDGSVTLLLAIESEGSVRCVHDPD